MKILIKWLLAAVALLCVAYLYSGVEVHSFGAALIAALLIGLCNAIVRPILVVLTLPVTVITLGLFFGLLVGWLTAYLGIPSFIVTLGGQLVFRGMVLGLTGGITIAPVHEPIKFVGQGYLPELAGDAGGFAHFSVAAATFVDCIADFSVSNASAEANVHK